MASSPRVDIKRLQCCQMLQNDIKHFNLSSEGKTLCLLGSEPKVIIFEMHMFIDSASVFPHRHTVLQIPSDKPVNKSIKELPLRDIYDNANILERQELIIDPVYMGVFSRDPPKVKTLQVECAPKNMLGGQSLIGILTTYGALHIYTKPLNSRMWDILLCNLNVLIESSIVVLYSPADVKSLSKFKKMVDAHWITAFTWVKDIFPAFDSNVIFLGSARGDIIGVSISEIGDAQVSSYTQTAGRICYLRAFRDLLLVGTVDGRVEIFRYQREGSEFVLERKDVLWDNQDRMGIRTAEISYSESLYFYFVIFTKGTNLIAFQLSRQGTRMCHHSRILLEGVKITGLVPISVHEFICTTLSHIYRIEVGIAEDEGAIVITEYIQTHDMDLKNFQIVGVGATPHNALISLMLFRNKPNQNPPTAAFVQMCKLTTCDALTILTSRQISALGDYIDCLSAIYLDMRFVSSRQRYEEFFNVIGGHLPTAVDEKTLLQAQIKWWILKFLRQRENLMLLQLTNNQIEVSFIETVARMLHILCRLQFLKQIDWTDWTPFQADVVGCLRLGFIEQRLQLLHTANNLNHSISTSMRLFVDWITPIYLAICDDLYFNAEHERCHVCQEVIQLDTFRCRNNHEVLRCVVSYIQLPYFNNYACSQCGCLVFVVHDLLKQLYPQGNVLSCPLCGFRLLPVTN